LDGLPDSGLCLREIKNKKPLTMNNIPPKKEMDLKEGGLLALF